MARHAHFTKSGPGRHHEQGNGERPHPRGFADTYLAARATALAESKAHRLQCPRDKHGMASTMVGRDPLRRISLDGQPIRRVWLGGISAQRGY